MKTQAFNENGTMRSIEAAVVLSMISFAGYTLLRAEFTTPLKRENYSMERTVGIANPFVSQHPDILQNTEKPAENPGQEVKERSGEVAFDKNYIASPERLAEFLDEEKALKLEERTFSIPEWFEENFRSEYSMEMDLPLVTFSSNSVTDELNRLVELKLFLVDEVEPAMEIKDWMTNETLFNPPAETMAESSDKSTIEVWKMKVEKFGNRTFLLTQSEDNKLGIEDWMTNETNWQAKQKKNSPEGKNE